MLKIKIYVKIKIIYIRHYLMGLIWEKWQDSINYRSLQINIESSNSNEKIENEIHQDLNEAYELLRSVRDSGNKELYKKFRQEYLDLYNEIKNALKSNKKFSKSERLSILLELWDIIKLAEDNWIKEKRSLFDKLLWRHKDNSKSKEKAQKLLEKNIKVFTKKEAIIALSYLNKNYSRYSKSNDTNKLFTFFYDTIQNLDDKYEVRLFQEKLIKMVLLEKDKWFNNEFIQWFNNKKWNFLIKTSDFSKYLEETTIKEINSIALANYIKYLYSIWANFYQNPKLLWWIDKLGKLLEFWKNNKQDWKAEKLIKDFLLKKESEIKQLLQTKDINIENLQSKNTEEIQKILRNKKLSEENIKQVIELIKFKRNMEFTKKILSFGLKWYNKLDTKYFFKNPEELVMITNKNKFLEVIKSIKDLKNLNYAYVNDIFKTDFDVLYELYKKRKELEPDYKFSFVQVKNIDIKELSKEQLKNFINIVDKSIIDYYIENWIITEEILKNIWVNFNKYSNNKNFIINKKDIVDYYDNIDDLDDKEKQILDNSLYKIIDEKGINKLIETLEIEEEESINFLFLPKTLNKILRNPNNIKKIIKIDPSFYLKALDFKKQSNKEYNIIYLQSLIDNNFLDENEQIQYLSKIRFDTVENALEIFKKLKERNKENIIKQLIRKPKFKSILYNFFLKKTLEIQDFIKKYPEYEWQIQEIQELFQKYNADLRNIWKYTKEKKEQIKKLNINKINKLEIDNIKISEQTLNYIKKLINENDESIKNTIILKLAEKYSYKEYVLLIDSIIKQTKQETTQKTQQLANIINKSITADYSNQWDFLKKLGLLTDKEFDPDKFIDLFEKRFIEESNRLKKDNQKINKEKLQQKVLNSLLQWCSNENLRKHLSTIINTSISSKKKIQYLQIIKEKEVYQIAKKWDIKELNKIVEKYNIEAEAKYYKKLKQKYNIKETETNNNQAYLKNSISSISSSNWNHSFTTSSWITIDWIGNKEFKQLQIEEKIDKNWKKIIKIWNPEALNNLINLKETLKELNLDFVWKYKENFYKAMRNIKWFAEINNLDWDNISKYELLNLLNFILKVIWEDWDFKDEEAAKQKIREINWWWIAWRKKDVFTELWPIWTIFEQKWYLNRRSSLHIINIEKLQDSNNWKKE